MDMDMDRDAGKSFGVKNEKYSQRDARTKSTGGKSADDCEEGGECFKCLRWPNCRPDGRKLRCRVVLHESPVVGRFAEWQ